MSERDAWSYVPHEGPHEFKPWCVYPPDWWAPGCTCGAIRSAGKKTESEEAMRLWWEAHAREAGHISPPDPKPDPTIYRYDPVAAEDAREELAGVTKGYIAYRPESGVAYVADAAILVGDDGEKRYQVMSDFRPTRIVDDSEGES